MDNREDNLATTVAVLQARAMEHERRITENELLSASRHKENRDAIHDLRNGQQAIVDTIHVNHVETVQGMGEIKGTVKYAFGAAAAAAALIELASHFIK